jgi:hypothetical protein
MGASIHINGTGSSIIDTVFVCRSTGSFPRRWLAKNPRELAGLVTEDIRLLREAELELTQGDTRCIIFGHLIRLAVWHLEAGWKRSLNIADRIKAVEDWISAFGGLEAAERELKLNSSPPDRTRTGWRQFPTASRQPEPTQVRSLKATARSSCLSREGSLASRATVAGYAGSNVHATMVRNEQNQHPTTPKRQTNSSSVQQQTRPPLEVRPLFRRQRVGRTDLAG